MSCERNTTDLLGMPGNVLASRDLTAWFPEWLQQYRIAWDNRAYNREEFKLYYGSLGPRVYRLYWIDAPEASDFQKHQALLRILKAQNEIVRMHKVATSFREHAIFDEDIINLIASFVHD